MYFLSPQKLFLRVPGPTARASYFDYQYLREYRKENSWLTPVPDCNWRAHHHRNDRNTPMRSLLIVMMMIKGGACTGPPMHADEALRLISTGPYGDASAHSGITML